MALRKRVLTDDQSRLALIPHATIFAKEALETDVTTPVVEAEDSITVWPEIMVIIGHYV